MKTGYNGREIRIDDEIKLHISDKIFLAVYFVLALAIGMYMDFKYATGMLFTYFIIAGPIIAYFLIRERKKTFELKQFAEKCLNEYINTALVRKKLGERDSFFCYDLNDIYSEIQRENTRRNAIYDKLQESERRLTELSVKCDELKEENWKLSVKLKYLQKKGANLDHKNKPSAAN